MQNQMIKNDLPQAVSHRSVRGDQNEFAVRKKEKQAEIDQIRMRCIAEISRTELPEGLEQTAFLKEKKRTGKIKRFFGNGPGAVS